MPRALLRFFPMLLFLIALAPRLVAINRYITPDELIWVYRSVVFREAVVDGRWIDTIVAGHPGVTTTWLGAAATGLTLLLNPSSRETYDLLARMAYLTPDNTAAFDWLATFLDPARLAVTLVTSLCIVGVYLLVRRLWGTRAAVIASLLLALDPFAAGLSGLLHVDGLSASFGLLSLLSLLVAIDRRASRPRFAWLAVSGTLAGAAVLSKSPLLVLIPMAGLILLVDALRGRDANWFGRLKRLLIDVAVWGLAMLLIVTLLYPAMWASPPAVVRSLTSNANRHIDEALRPTFFMGRALYDPGPLFYPVVLLWRLSPVVLLGVLSLPLALRRGRARLTTSILPIAALLSWAVLFLLAITPAAKKFDRYALPALMALIVVAGVALTIWASRGGRARRIAPVAVAAQALYMLFFVAYPLAAYNPLIGGPWTAARVLPVGWAEGISTAGRQLADSQSAAADQAAMAGVAPSLVSFFPGHTLVDGIDDRASADYLIETLSGRQLAQAGVGTPVSGVELIQTIRFGGLEQAWVYRQTPTAAAALQPLPEAIRFGDGMLLTAAQPRAMGDGIVQLVAEWRRARPAAADERYLVSVVLRDAAGNEWAAVQTDLLNAAALYPADWPVADSGAVHYLMDTPPGIPPGDYRMELVVIDARSGNRLPGTLASGGFLGVVVGVGILTVPPSTTPDVVTRMAIPVVDDQFLLDGALRLLGHSQLPAEALAGSDVPVDLYWHAPGSLPAGLALEWQLAAADGDPLPIMTGPLSGYDTGLWRPSETIHEKYLVSLPPMLEPGDYALRVQLLDDGLPASDPLEIGRLRINNIDRLYELPTDMPVTVDATWGEGIHLRGLNLQPTAAAPGSTPELTLYWRTDVEPEVVYTVFVHLLAADGAIVAQFDHWPGGLPSDIWAADQVIIDRFPLMLPADLPAGEYRVALGLYTAEDGVRLPVRGRDATDPDRVILPLTLTVTPP